MLYQRIWYMFSVIFSIASFVGFLFGHKLGEWSNQLTLPKSYMRISTSNVLRCGNLCTRQGKCISATFDNLERICYLQASEVVAAANYSTGRYLLKTFLDNLREPAVSRCDKHKQISVPSVDHKYGRCHNLSGLIGHACTMSNDCIVESSECRTHERKCGCRVGYSFQSSTQTCEADCVVYGDTFQSFEGHGLKENNARTYAVISTAEECANLCGVETAFVCRSCDYRDDGRCDLAEVDASELLPSFYKDWPNTIHYQRNCF